jgi:hypothetical protein
MIEISPPGGKKVREVKGIVRKVRHLLAVRSSVEAVMSGRLTYFPLGKGQNPVYYFFKQAQIVTVL